MSQLKKVILFILLILPAISFSQTFTLPNEEVIFSFNTKSGKTVSLNKDKENKYIIYRFGTKQKIEFEFPTKTKESWKAFKYSYYMRGGGTDNEGMDLNYISFTNNEFTYALYDCYYAAGNKQTIGIKLINNTTKKITNIVGDKKTQKGTMVDFRDNNLLEIGEELFD